MNGFITYDGLPLKSGGAHHLGSKPTKLIYAGIDSFLNKYTNSKKPHYLIVELSTLKLSRIIKYSLKFGMPYFGQGRVYWHASIIDIDLLIEKIAQTDELLLSILWRFRFIDLISGQVLPGQSEMPVLDERIHNSQLYLRLSTKKSTLSTWFALPFNTLSDSSLKYIKGMQMDLPFKFSEQSWRLWKQSKDNHWIPKKLKIN